MADSRALLVAEIGSVTTSITLVDLVEGEHRLIGRVEVPSTLEQPTDDALLAVLAGAQQIGETTARELLRDGRLLMPETDEGDGVDGLVVVSSAAGSLSLVITAVASDVSARSAQHASRCTYTSLLQVITLDEEGRTAGTTGGDWIERQVQALVGLQPQVVLMAGGIEDGAADALIRLARIVALTSQRSVVDEHGQTSQDVNRRLVLFAGNSAVDGPVVAALAGRADPIVVANLRPALEHDNLQPARDELSRLYDQRVLPGLPGYSSLQRLAASVGTSAAATSLMARYIAQRNKRNVLVADVGAQTTACYLDSQGRFSPTLLTGCGVGYGAATVLAERGAAQIARWLPFAIGDDELTHWVLNKTLRPHVQPTSRRDLLIEHALAREALAMVYLLLRDERGDAPYDLIVGQGGVLAHAPQPGLAALTLLDALEPGGGENELAIDMHLDALGLLTAAGALAQRYPEAAIALFEHDGLQNVPLATCVVALGNGRDGEPALEAELRSGGKASVATVRHGEIARLPLPRGRRGELLLRPAGGVRVGRGLPGKEVGSDAGAIGGSALGVIIDARSRPLLLPEDPAERQGRVWNWLVALGAERGENPYRAATPRRISFEAAAIAPEPAAAPAAIPAEEQPESSVEQDLARLRQTVQEEPKRGWFRRK